jgi:hypothetical protein
MLSAFPLFRPRNRHKDGIGMTGPTFSEFLQAIFDRFALMEEDGKTSDINRIDASYIQLNASDAVFLRPKSDEPLVTANMSKGKETRNIFTDANL